MCIRDSAGSDIVGTVFNWSTGDVGSVITVSPASTTVYTVTGTTPNQCTGTTQVTVVVNQIPQVQAIVSDPEICAGEDITVQAFSDDPNAFYSWSNGQNVAGFTVNPMVTTIYTVTVISSQQCTNTAQVQVTVHPTPIANIIPSSGSICLNQNASLLLQTNIPVSSIVWSTGDINVQSINVSPMVSTTYGVTVSTDHQCTGTANITIQVNPLPDVHISATSEEVCEGNSTTLAATSNHPNTVFLWSNGIQAPSISVTPWMNTWYYVTATDQNGCKNKDSVEVVVNPNPKVSIIPSDDDICEGFSVTLTATSNHPNTSFAWNTGAIGPIINVTPVVTTTYMVTGTDGNGCTGSNRVVIEVKQNPAVFIAPLGSPICPGDTVWLQAGVNEMVRYIWSTGDTTQTIMVIPNSTSLYSVTVTNQDNCSTTAQLTVEVRPAPQIIVYPSKPVICKGDQVTLIATGASLYDWTPSTGLNTNVGSIVVASPSENTTYRVEGIDLYGCKGETLVTVEVKPIPNINFTSDMNQICAATTVRFVGSSDQPISSWQWDFGDPSSGSANYGMHQIVTHTFFATGTYTIRLEVVSVDGCKNAIVKPDYIVVHPNPMAAFYRTPDITTVDNATIKFFNQSVGHVKVLWNFDDPSSGINNISTQSDPTHTYSMEGEYWPTLYVENEWGCVDSMSNRIIVKSTSGQYIPSAFSPNNDGVNDIFKPSGFNIDWTEYTMYIFDRWGNQIFETHSIDIGWDGRVNGQGEIVQQDVYVYKIILKDIYGVEHVFYGHVTLIK
ncbi:MAG: PKD domain-containing protein, partial [Bacteroidales bacterium]|nr:PKD domain-containing protein [Bacteroidales bacterium]